MDLNFKAKFEDLFAKYFPGAELPLVFYYADELTFAAPMKNFARLVDALEESFVITRSWEKVMRRL